MKITLASGSPRRAKILEALGVEFDVVKTDAPEASYPHDPERTVRENALAKGAAAAPRHSSPAKIPTSRPCTICSPLELYPQDTLI